METAQNVPNYMVDLDRVRSYIRQLMAENRVTTAKLAEKTAISKGTLDNFFDGSTKAPTFDKVCTIIIMLGGSIDEALGISKKEEEQQKLQMVGIEHITAAHSESIATKNEVIADLRAELAHERRKHMTVAKWQIAVSIESVVIAILATAFMLLK